MTFIVLNSLSEKMNQIARNIKLNVILYWDFDNKLSVKDGNYYYFLCPPPPFPIIHQNTR